MSYVTSQLIEKLESLGLSPKKALGQNFLVSEAVIEKICKAAQGFGDQFVEIGPGLGALTETLFATAKSYEVIELDRAFAQMWRDKGITVNEVDALKFDWSHFADRTNTVLVSNLPYQISASIVIDRSIDPIPFKAMVLMFQKEVAQRIMAKQASEHYGMLSVMAQTFWKVSLVTDAGPKDFYPPPRVASRVLKFEPLASGTLAKDKFLSFVKVGFAHRRKLLSSNLTAYANLEKSWIEQTLESMNKKASARAEELTPEQFVQLFEKCHEHISHR